MTVTVNGSSVVVQVRPKVQQVKVFRGPPGPKGDPGEGGDASEWLLDLQTGNTLAARQHNSAERDEAIEAYGEEQVALIKSPPGEFYFADQMVLEEPIALRGAGMWFKNGSNWWTPAGMPCVEILYQGGPAAAGARGTLIEQMRFGPAAGGVFDESTPGILLKARATLRNVNITSAHGHGVAVVASTGDGDNANLARFDNVRADANLGHGFFFDGADANACLLTACDAASNAMDGFNDDSFLGVFLAGCHAEANAGRSYSLGIDPNADSMAFQCYVEGGQGLVLLNGKALWVGPYPPGGFDPAGTGLYWTPSKGNSFIIENEGVYAKLGRLFNALALEYGAAADGNQPWQLIYSNGVWSLKYDGTHDLEQHFDDTFATAEERRAKYFPYGFSAPKRLYNRTGDRNGSAWDTSKVQTNRGAGAMVTYNLPASHQVEDGWFADFYVATAQYLKVKGQAGDSIRLTSTVSAEGGYIRTNTVGDAFRVMKVKAQAGGTGGQWAVVNYIGSGLVVDI